VSTGQIAAEKLDRYAMVGELALDGTVRPVAGALSMAMEARARGIAKLIVPAGNAREASVVGEVEVYGVGSLAEAVGVVTGLAPLDPFSPPLDDIQENLNRYSTDFADVKGQEFAKRALTVAASGGHNVVMLGSPGSGKTMLARRLPTILPPLTPDESLETTRVYSAIGKLAPARRCLCTRPFRSPHHSISGAGMVGGGSVPQPGEISLAHHGVLFLDELPEFNRNSLEALRQPLEEGPRHDQPGGAQHHVPGRLHPVRRDEPVPVRVPGRPEEGVQVRPDGRREVHGPDQRPLARPHRPAHRSSAGAVRGPVEAGRRHRQHAMREQVYAAREVQVRRFGSKAGGLNGRMTSRQIREFCVLDADGQSTLKDAMEALGLSARAHDRICEWRERSPTGGQRPHHAGPRGRGDWVPRARPQAVGAVTP
jgi:magnesium chelatase family protein